MDIRIMIAMHKPYDMPQDEIYLPVFVGAEGKDNFGICGDNTGDNISLKNPGYCELTGLYWGWKNLTADAVGLVHYRRYFTARSRAYRKHHPLMECVLTGTQVQEALEEADILVPKKRRYYIENLYSHYAHTFDGRHLDMAADIIRSKYPKDVPYISKVYQRTWGYMFNMFVMKKKWYDDYCRWLFPILFALEDQMKQEESLQQLSAFEGRLYGRVSEILFNVWLEKQLANDVTIKELAYMHMEPVNWMRKGTDFLKAKFVGTKYKESF